MLICLIIGVVNLDLLVIVVPAVYLHKTITIFHLVLDKADNSDKYLTLRPNLVFFKILPLISACISGIFFSSDYYYSVCVW